jgi:hypothetical protein
MTVWKTLEEVQGYEVSALGEIRCVLRGQGRRFGQVLSPHRSSRGYWEVRIRVDGKSKIVSVHRAVCAAFYGPCPDGMQVRHLDGDKNNNRLDNLRYGTPKENGEDNARLAAIPRGEDSHANTALTLADAQQAVDWLAEGASPTAIALALEVPRNAIYKIKYGESWTWLKPQSANNRQQDRATH